jgi:hypothetical protein
MKMTALWNIALCCLVGVDRRFRDATASIMRDRPDDGDSTHL